MTSREEKCSTTLSHTLPEESKPGIRIMGRLPVPVTRTLNARVRSVVCGAAPGHAPASAVPPSANPTTIPVTFIICCIVDLPVPY